MLFLLFLLQIARAAVLTQEETNGASVLGTLVAPTYPLFITANSTPIIDGYPWGTKTANNTDAYTGYPNTGKTRFFDWTITRETIAPDGYSKPAILINNAFPGPVIEVNWGDIIEVTVHNGMTDEGTTIHWHGFLQKETTWEDGVPGISMCPIPPGSSFTYSFQAQLYGTSWYHSHYSSQYADGLWGPIIVHGPKNVAYDIDIGPVTLSDLFHGDYYTLLEGVMSNSSTAVHRPYSDNNLINGKNDFNCSSVNVTTSCSNDAPLAQFNFTSGKAHRLRLINTSGQAIQKFSIDDHTMTVMANDFVPVEPYNTTIVTLGIGQRTDVVVQATGSPNQTYWMRSNIVEGACTENAHQPYAKAIIYYEDASLNAIPTTTAQVDDTPLCANDDLTETIPYYPIAAGTPYNTTTVEIALVKNSTGYNTWVMNGQTFQTDYNDPILLEAKKGNTSYPLDPKWNVYNYADVPEYDWIRIILNNNSSDSHPMHLHGHNMYILAEGTGEWDGSIVRANNPQRRDTQILQANGYLVLEFQTDNPGVWPLHCHIVWHVSAGFQFNILERPADIVNLPIPAASTDLCTAWGTWTDSNVVDQIDSGDK